MNKPLNKIVNFKDLISAANLTENAYQLAYAQRIEEFLNNTSISYCAAEASTGIGKSISYLYESINFGIKNRRQVVIAVPTIQLANQLIDCDLQLIRDLFLKHDIGCFKMGLRISHIHYVEPERVKLKLLLETAPTDEMYHFHQWANDCAKNGSGLIDEYEELGYTLPFKKEDICVLNGAETELDTQNRQYLNDQMSQNDVDVLVTTHASLAQYCLNKNILPTIGDKPILIVDEAHLFEGFCHSLMYKKVPLSELTALAEHLLQFDIKAMGCSPKPLYKIVQSIKDLQGSLTTYNNELVVAYNELQSDDSVELSMLLTDIAKFLELFGAKLTSEQPETVELKKELSKISNWLQYYLDSAQYNFIYFTEKSKKPGLCTYSSSPARVIRNIINRMPEAKVIFTSATLSSSNKNLQNDFNGFLSSMGLKVSEVDTFSLNIENFGEPSVVLTSARMETPIQNDVDETYRYSNRWLKHTTNIIKQAAQNNERILVVVPSYSESDKLGNLLNEQKLDVVEHKRGSKLGSVLSSLIAKQSQVLITPAAWDGFSVRTLDGQQFFKHVIVTRLPIAPTDEFELALFLKKSKFSGLHDNTPEAVIKDWYRGRLVRKSIHKFKQVIGRLIRGANDSGTLWICDPRFPLPDSHTKIYQGFKYSIPKHFDSAYQNARIFEYSGFIDSLQVQAEDKELIL